MFHRAFNDAVLDGRKQFLEDPIKIIIQLHSFRSYLFARPNALQKCVSKCTSDQTHACSDSLTGSCYLETRINLDQVHRY